MSERSVNPGDELARLLRGEPGEFWSTCDTDAVLTAAREHDVVALVAERLSTLPGANPQLQADLRDESQRLAAADLASEAELRRLLAALASRGVRALLIKGSHLAYSHYPRPDLRARVDSDLLIHHDQREPARQVLAQLGYDADAKMSGEFTATQQLYVRYRHGVAVHLVDLHWRLASPQVFAHVLSFDELFAAACPLPSLSPSAFGPCNVHALVIACIHRVAHHHDEAETLKWIYDIHLIASRMDPADWDTFVTLAGERRIGAVCLDGLERASAWLGTSVPERVSQDARLRAAQHETTSAYLRPRAQATVVLDDLRALPTWKQRLQLAREHLLPPRAHMRQIYAPDSRLPLPILYAVRLARGMRSWLTPPTDRG